MDADYGRNLDAAGAPVTLRAEPVRADHGHEPRRTRAARCVTPASRPQLRFRHAAVVGVPGATYVTRPTSTASSIDGPGAPALGHKLLLMPGHCDPTVNLHDWFVCVRNGGVEALWPITARGAMY